MAGPAIRYWEFAQALSKHSDVTLSTPNVPDIQSETFTIKPRTMYSFLKEIPKADVIVTQLISHGMAWIAKRHGIRIILDAYDPIPLEVLEIFKFSHSSVRNYKNQYIVNLFILSFQMADAFLCANIQQRDLWTGLLMGLKRITPNAYLADPKLRDLIDIVPFGLSESRPKHSGNGLRKMFNLKETDKVILWGGGIWNWFDPLTLIKAVNQLALEGCPVHLVFMGIKHPNEAVGPMKMAADAVQLAKDLNIFNKYVFFNFGWTPYQQRQDFLLDADIGVSTHSEHLETRYAFRTRLLDYIWAGLPILATTGDSFSGMIESEKLGVVVPYEDTQSIVQAIKKMLMDPILMQNMRDNLERIRSEFYWDTLVEPIERMTKELTSRPKKKMSFRDARQVFSSFYAMRGPGAIYKKLLSIYYADTFSKK